MNRRLFVGQLVTGACVLGTPSSLIAHSLSPLSGQLVTDATSKNIIKWAQNGSLGELQHITLSHVYSPNSTSVLALVAMVQADIATVNALLGTDFTLTSQALLRLASSEYGSHSVQCERAGVKLTWQGLAYIGGEAKKPVGQLRLYGNKGTVQAMPNGIDYQLVDLYGKAIQVDKQISEATKRLSRRSFFTV